MSRFALPLPSMPDLRALAPRALLRTQPPLQRLALLTLFAWSGLVIAATLTGIVMVELAATPDLPPALKITGTRSTRLAGNAAIEKPLFVRSRALAVAAPPPPPPPPPMMAAPPAMASRDGALTLKGVYIADRTARAFVVTPSNPTGVWLSPQEEIGGWRLVAVRPGEIELSGGSERLLLPLFGSTP